MPEESRRFVSSLIDYYAGAAASYVELASAYRGVAGSVKDAALGMMAGGIYSGFMQSYQARGASPSLEEMREFNLMMRKCAPRLMEAVEGASR